MLLVLILEQTTICIVFICRCFIVLMYELISTLSQVDKSEINKCYFTITLVIVTLTVT